MEGSEFHVQVPRHMNPYVKLQIIDVDAYKREFHKKHTFFNSNNAESDNEVNVILEHILSARVLLHRIKVFKCKKCLVCYLNINDLRLHSLKHVEPILKLDNASKNYVKRFKCEDCDLKFVEARTLKAHSIFHQPFPYICHCGVGYYKPIDLNSHKELVHAEVIDWTAKTSYTGRTESTLKTKLGMIKSKSKSKTKKKQSKHIIKRKKSPNLNTDNIVFENGIRRFFCATCKKTYGSRAGLEIHTRVHTGERPYSCEICNKSFTQPNVLKQHLDIHAGVKFNCTYCNKALTTKINLMLHERIHTGYKPYSCTYCQKDFSDPSAFARHVRTHTGDKRYKCPQCPMAFTDASGLIAHRKRMHIKKREFSFKTCGHKFFSNAEVVKHSIVHTGRKPFQCDDCGKCFTFKTNLCSHITKLQGKHKLRKCKYCSYTTYNKKFWNNHMLTHDKITYECHACEKKFISKVFLIRHIERRH